MTRLEVLRALIANDARNVRDTVPGSANRTVAIADCAARLLQAKAECGLESDEYLDAELNLRLALQYWRC